MKKITIPQLRKFIQETVHRELKEANGQNATSHQAAIQLAQALSNFCKAYDGLSADVADYGGGLAATPDEAKQGQHQMLVAFTQACAEELGGEVVGDDGFKALVQRLVGVAQHSSGY